MALRPPPRSGQRRLRRTRQRRTVARRQDRRLASRVQGARTRLRPYRRASILAVAMTGFLLMLVSPSDSARAQEDAAEEQVRTDTPEEAPAPGAAGRPLRAGDVARETEQEAERTLVTLQQRFLAGLPKVAVALGVLVLAWVLVRILRGLLHLALGRWERGSATIALVGIAVWMLAVGLAVSVITGDLSGLLGGIGLVGLALSWALQTPIESFTGWLLNSFQGYYRVGDRIEVGEVFGDVAEIDFLTTTLWELGGPGRSSFIHAEQPTGRLITLPNSVVLTGTVVNLTREFPHVWDELIVHVEKETDVPYALEVLGRVARETFGSRMEEPARQYEALLRRASIDSKVAPHPEVFVTLEEGFLGIFIRYLVGARERRLWKTELLSRVLAELREPAHAGRILLALPRQQLQFIGADGMVRDRFEVQTFVQEVKR